MMSFLYIFPQQEVKAINSAGGLKWETLWTGSSTSISLSSSFLADLMSRDLCRITLDGSHSKTTGYEYYDFYNIQVLCSFSAIKPTTVEYEASSSTSSTTRGISISWQIGCYNYFYRQNSYTNSYTGVIYGFWAKESSTSTGAVAPIGTLPNTLQSISGESWSQSTTSGLKIIKIEGLVKN